jgi:electron transfer flavoprotein alpha subunit
MQILVVLEHDGESLRAGSLSAIQFARQLAQQQDGQLHALLLGHDCQPLIEQARQYAPLLVASHPQLAYPLADRQAKVIADVVRNQQATVVIAASSTFSKDVVGRAAGLLGGCMASDVVSHRWHDDQLLLKRPMYAGAILATVRLHGTPSIITVRATAYPAAEQLAAAADVETVTVDEARLPRGTEFEQLDSKPSHRPDVTEASVVVSGGRAIHNSDDFEQLVGGLADCLGAATGSSRALVDAGITPNALQVGQTGKIVSPQLYLALGISGAVQHLAGMKNSRIIAAVNTDPHAPIFEVADYGLVADLYEVVPEMIDKLSNHNA